MRAWVTLPGGLALLLTGVLVLAGVLALELRDSAPAADTRPRPAAPVPTAAAGTAPAPGTPRGQFAAVALERPLFSATRRPAAQAALAAPASVFPPRLAGVLAGPFGRRAIFAGPDGGKPLVVQPGDTVGEYRVQSIEDGFVTLAGPEGQRRLRPAFANVTTPSAGASTDTPAEPAAPGMPSGLPPGILPEDLQQTGRRP